MPNPAFRSNSSVTRLPVIYAFGQLYIDLNPLINQIRNALPHTETKLLLICDTLYAHSLGISIPNLINIDPIYDCLVSLGYKNATKRPIPTTENVIQPRVHPTAKLLPDVTPLPDTTLLFVAEPRDTAATLLTYHYLAPKIYTYSPQSSTLTLSSPSTSLRLRRRYVAVQKARDSGAIGLVIGTLGKEGYLSLISLLRKMILDRGKKPYLLALGKLNPAKVANFSECDCFCIIACPESTVVDNRVFHDSLTLLTSRNISSRS